MILDQLAVLMTFSLMTMILISVKMMDVEVTADVTTNATVMTNVKTSAKINAIAMIIAKIIANAMIAVKTTAVTGMIAVMIHATIQAIVTTMKMNVMDVIVVMQPTAMTAGLKNANATLVTKIAV